MQEVQRRKDLISHRVLERPGQFGSSVGVGGRMGGREKRETKRRACGVHDPLEV